MRRGYCCTVVSPRVYTYVEYQSLITNGSFSLVVVGGHADHSAACPLCRRDVRRPPLTVGREMVFLCSDSPYSPCPLPRDSGSEVLRELRVPRGAIR